MSIPAIREGIRALQDRHAAAAVSRLSEFEVAGEMTLETIEVLIIVGTLREATRRQIEERRLQDSAGLLERMVRRGLLAKRSEEDQRGQPNAYRLTARALGVAWCAEQIARAEAVTSQG